MSKHTPTPWTMEPLTDDPSFSVVYPDEHRVYLLKTAHATMAVEAVNSHAALRAENARLREALGRSVTLMQSTRDFIAEEELGGYVESILEHHFIHDGEENYADGYGFGIDLENAIDRARAALAATEVAK